MEDLALLGGAPAHIPIAKSYPRFTDAAVERVANLLRSGTTVGLNKTCREIEEAEKAIASWQGVTHCLGTSSGHAALHSALIGLEITGGDEVITTPYTWGASISCILHNNAVPVFADVDPITGLLDPAAVEACITPRTAAIMPVHIFGQAADMTALCAIARKHGLAVIEDGSQAHSTLHAGKKVGSFGDAAGFSCMGGKLLATSEAGYLVTDDEMVYWKASMGGQHMARAPEGGFPEELLSYVDSLVYTYRLNPINAVLLVEQLGKIDSEIAARRDCARMFREKMAEVTCVSFPDYEAGDEPSYHMLTMNFEPQNAGISRETYLKAVGAEGAGAFAYVPSPIPTWPRLQTSFDGPPVMWTKMLAAAGVDYSAVEIPNCVRKIGRAVELSWNFLEVDEAEIASLAAVFIKVENNLDALIDWERHKSTG